MSISVSSIKQKLLNSALFHDSFWALLGSVLGKGLSLVAGVVVARFLGKEIYGEYGMIKNTLLQIAVFSTLGLGYSGTRFIAKYWNEDLEKVNAIIRVIYVITLSVSGFLALLLFIFSQEVALFLEVPETALAFKCTALIIIFNAVTTAQIGILAGFKSFKVIAINNTICGIITFVFSIVLTYFFNLYGALIALLISMIANTAINSISIHRICPPFPKVNCSSGIYGELIRFSVPLALQESLYSIVAWTLSLLMIKFSDYGELGLYQAAAQWSGIVLFIPGVLKNVILSYFSSSGDPSVLRRRLILINFVATFIPFLLFTALSRFISSFYGASFTGLPIVIIVSCLSSVFASVISVLLYELVSTGHTWASFTIRVFRDIAILSIVYILLNGMREDISGSLIVVSVQCVICALFIPITFFTVKKSVIYHE